MIINYHPQVYHAYYVNIITTNFKPSLPDMCFSRIQDTSLFDKPEI